MADDFWKSYKHPKWQEKRLRIMERAGFKCEWCEHTDTTLHVHHTYYEKGAKPWEYGDGALLCLCERCHSEAHAVLDYLKHLLGQVAVRNAGELGLIRLEGYLNAMVADQSVNEEPRASYFEPGGNGPELQGVADYYGLTWGEVNEVVDGGGLDVWALRRLAADKKR